VTTPVIIVRLRVGVCLVPPHPSPLPKERESTGKALENPNVAVAVPASLSFVSVAHHNQARSHYPSTGECFSLSPRERVGVRGNIILAALAASALGLQKLSGAASFQVRRMLLYPG
jgi:hypothetical protein